MRMKCALFECCFPGISVALPTLTYTEIAEAANNFHPSRCLGSEKFTKVYHGVLQDGREIAIKRFWDFDSNIFQQYVKNIVIFNELAHKNLVSIYGYAYGKKEYLLVYEYVPNGTLAYHLLGDGAEHKVLPWLTRLDIATDTAKALAYLHSEGIIHSNVTPYKILLDGNFCAKLTVSLLSWQLPTAKGVSGFDNPNKTDKERYQDEEYLRSGKTSLKSDVYSFGVVLCEILSSRPVNDWEYGLGLRFQLFSYPLDKLLDPILWSVPGIKQMLTAVAVLAYECLNDDKELRPSMEEVLERLNGIREGRWNPSLIADLKGDTLEPVFLQDYVKPPFKIFSKNELSEVTNNFKNCLGKGGFGTVYYGKLLDGHEVAIKRFHEKKDRTIEQFMKEIEILSLLRHQNLVSLYGRSSDDSDELLLVYEYVSNGPLASYLHRNSSNKLPWLMRLNIAIETASALAYLHDSGIIHRDVKPSNILLDKKLSVKVADFGLARLLPLNGSLGHPTFVTHVSTAPVGTPAYIDPEYYESNRVSDKSDVYSFGVVLFQLVSSKPSSFTQGPQYFTLANFAMDKILNNALEELVDPSLGFDSNNRVMETVTAMAELAFQCVQCPKELRPSMKQVLETLEGIKQGAWGFNQIT